MSESAARGENTPDGRIRGDFIHVPYIREQKDLPEKQPALSLEETVRTVEFLMAYMAADLNREKNRCGSLVK